MGDHSHIQWTEATWNPVLGCRKVSAGCNHCYAMRDAHRLSSNPNAKVAAAYAGLTTIQNGRVNWTGVFREMPGRLGQPLCWKKPRRIFVNSMSDLFGEGVSDEFILRVFMIMRLAHWHQFQVLTKRPKRMQHLLSVWLHQPEALADRSLKIKPPAANVWLGVSVEDQKAADERIPLLLQTPAAVRFVSCEPLLGPVSLTRFLSREIDTSAGAFLPAELRSVDWVIVGGESGPGARPMEEHWATQIVDDCRRNRIACFVKQMGSRWAERYAATDRKGGDPAEWPEWLRVRECPDTTR